MILRIAPFVAVMLFAASIARGQNIDFSSLSGADVADVR
jgi:hypothetical protein